MILYILLNFQRKKELTGKRVFSLLVFCLAPPEHRPPSCQHGAALKALMTAALKALRF